MRFVKFNSIIPITVKGREDNADMANKIYLRFDLAKEWGDINIVRGGRYRSKNIRKSKAIIKIEKWVGLAMRLFIDAKEYRIEIVFFETK
jgi:hypothetical protein